MQINSWLARLNPFSTLTTVSLLIFSLLYVQHRHLTMPNSHLHPQEADKATLANKAFFNTEFAQNAEPSEARDLGTQIGQHSLQFTGQETAPGAVFDWSKAKVLDFACGTGMISETLAPHVHEAVGVDISPDMVSVYNGKTINNMAAFEFDLIAHENRKSSETDASATSKAIGSDFDAAVCSLAYHHFTDISQANHALYARLKKQGWAIVVDFAEGTAEDGGAHAPAEGHEHGHDHGHSHSHEHAHGHGHGHSHSHGHDDHLPHKGGFSPTLLTASLAATGFSHCSAHTFLASAWATADFKRMFKWHYDPAQEAQGKEPGMKVWDEKVDEDGTRRYLVKWKMVMAYGQKL